jgi:hypothetical protein
LGKPASRLAGSGTMIHVTAQMRVLVAIEPVDGRKRIDSLVRLCQAQLGEDPFSVLGKKLERCTFYAAF